MKIAEGRRKACKTGNLPEVTPQTVLAAGFLKLAVEAGNLLIN
jgi:hypothetical protein